MNIRKIHSIAWRHAAGALAIVAAAATLTTTAPKAQAQNGLVGSWLNSPSRGQQAAVGFGSDVQIVQASDVRTAANVNGTPGAISQALGTSIGDLGSINTGMVKPVASYYQSCSTCGPAACNGSCGQTSNVCGIPCDPYRYVNVEALIMDRGSDDSFTLSRSFLIEEFDFEWAPRITFGSVPNCVNGYEFTWVGPLEHDRRTTQRAAAGLFSVLSAAPTFNADFIAPFNNAQFHDQLYESTYYSAEANRVLVGWDVVKVLLGARYIRLEEEYLFSTIGTGPLPGGATGALASNTENNLIGLQAGLDMVYPIAQYASTDFRLRGGVYANIAESDVQLFNQGAIVLRNAPDDVDIAGVFEFGSGIRYQLGEALTIRAGGEFWYITGVATAPGQIQRVVSNSLGSNLDIEDDVFYYGGVFGAEFRF
ncbi:MAG: hypothetical protein AAFX06_25230 [Planctomycetota bacterium]